MKNTLFSYVHIPFCRQKCHYCKFALTPVFTDVKIELYLGHLRKEIGDFLKISTGLAWTWDSWDSRLRGNDGEVRENDGGMERKDELKSIYFGGGTPSILTSSQVAGIVSLFEHNTLFAPDIEITLEANPEDITTEYVRELKNIGVNRLSLWVQSLNPMTLQEIGRSDPETIFRALDVVSEIGFENVNVDLILGLPHVGQWETLKNARILLERYPLQHMSLYILEEENYPSHWKDVSMDQEAMQAEHIAIREVLIDQWFLNYEISNFAKPGYESRHNRSYWDHSNVRGFGLSAASHLDGQRFANSTSFSGYYDGKLSYSEMLDAESLRIEHLMFGIRTDGMDPEDITYYKKYEQYIQEGLLKEKNGKIIPTSAWIFLIDHIIGELI